MPEAVEIPKPVAPIRDDADKCNSPKSGGVVLAPVHGPQEVALEVEFAFDFLRHMVSMKRVSFLRRRKSSRLGHFWVGNSVKMRHRYVDSGGAQAKVEMSSS